MKIIHTLDVYYPFNIYIIKTDPDNPIHHGLHTNTAKYLLTRDVHPGDQIAYVLRGMKTIAHTSEKLEETWMGISSCIKEISLSLFSSCYDHEDEQKIRILSHLGRSVLPGEDGVEDAFGQECLEQLIVEIIQECDWVHAPVAIEVIEAPPRLDADEFSNRNYLEWRKDREIKIEQVDGDYKRIDSDFTEDIKGIMVEQRTKFLRSTLRDKVITLDDSSFEEVKNFCLNFDRSPSTKEWIERSPGREWSNNPVAMTIFEFISPNVTENFTKRDILNLISMFFDSNSRSQVAHQPNTESSSLFF